MPLNSEGLPTQLREEFCLALKAARERSGVSLASIAEATKIPASMFVALERNDLRCWPKGLFRRCFFRGYAEMIGVPMAETCAEFLRLFPDDGGAKVATAAGQTPEAGQAEDVRLVLDPAWHGPRASVLSRLLAALLDAGAVVFVAAAVAWVAGVGLAVTTAVVALAYFSLAMALFGESPARWALSWHRSLLDAMTQGPAALPSVLRRAAEAISHLVRSADDGSDPAEGPEMHSHQLRVRIKMSQ